MIRFSPLYRLFTAFIVPAISGLALACAPSMDDGGSPREPAPLPEDSLARKVDAYLEPLTRSHDLSGVILIGSGAEIAYEGAWGEARPGRPNTLRTRFAIASLTKPLTAGAALIAEKEGLLDREDRLDQHGFEFERAGEIDVWNLLTHSSGLSNPDYRRAFEERIDLDELVRRITAQPLQFDPGQRHSYSNAGYNVLARVIENTSGLSYDEFLRRRILDPLGMESTGHDFDRTGENLALGHVPGPPPGWRVETPFSDLGFSIGSGSLYSTAPDLLAWGRAVAEERLFNWKELDWPYGWGKVEIGSHRGLEQTGATTGFMSALLVFPKDRLVIVVLLNQELGDWAQVGRGLASIVFDEPHEPVSRPEPVELDPADISRYAGEYFSADSSLEVVDRGGHLWVHSAGWPVGKYLTPLADSTFRARSDTGTISFHGRSEGGFREFRWAFGDSAQVYTRR